MPLFAFSQKVDNIRFEQVGKQINIYYDLQGEGNCNVNIYYSEDGGNTWGSSLVNVTGAVGENQKPGANKMIIWDVLKDKDKLSGEIKFKIEAISFFCKSGYFKDKRDGKRYSWVRIGAQIWMAENLNYSTNDSWCHDNNKTNCDKYGRLYNWEAAKKACPVGWYLPSDNDWKQMEMALGMSQGEAEDVNGRGINEAKKIKSTSGWDLNGNGTNSSGFNALPGGFHFSDGSFGDLGFNGNWWSSSQLWYRLLYYKDDRVYRYNESMARGFSVRCLKN